ncbi:MAG: ABC transporter permease subunit/CPBP intramembrane protease [Planctomycetota bacterium]|nr:ABC transporter permease subunit/CPBP intramembrane protease [Planctomycetota bacterium]
MNWRHIQLIFQREMSDQLRDRRTLFTITILPLLLYPFIGMLMTQVAQFKRDSSVSIQVFGLENWPKQLPLLDENGELQVRPGMESLVKGVTFDPYDGSETDREALEKLAKESIDKDRYDLVLFVEENFREKLTKRLKADESASSESLSAGELPDQSAAEDTATDPGVENLAAEDTPSQEVFADKEEAERSLSNDGLSIIANLARDKSQLAQRRLGDVIRIWQKEWTSLHLTDAGVNPKVFEPINLQATDTAPTAVKKAMLWAKILPFVMLIWALTGAFYPAIDLCAGEKERGTLETLLSSPARRREIVWGKLGTIFVFSVASALLNLFSMYLTASLIVKQLAAASPGLQEALGPMPFHALGWLLLLLIPMAAIFSALALAVAALARSTKEGQYYLMPLLLVTLPLVAIPMMPSLEMNLGTSLLPISGAIFLIRAFIEGRLAEAFVHMPFVLGVTATCCWFSIRWAIRQFESESVMFAGSERWNLRLWVHHLWRAREDTATPPEAILCGIIIIVALFFGRIMAGAGTPTWLFIVQSTIVVQVGLILTPCLLMATLLTRSVRKSLRIHRPQTSHVLAAIALGFCMHPSYMLLAEAVTQIYQVGDDTKAALSGFEGIVTSAPLWGVICVFALLPALCEETVFRGFIFGGLLRQKGVLRAIIVSALFFGFVHPVLQQSISACFMGVLLGFIAWRTGGIICTVIIHAINNALGIGYAWLSANDYELPPALAWAMQTEESGAWGYTETWVFVSMLLSIALLFVIARRSTETQRFIQAEMA